MLKPSLNELMENGQDTYSFVVAVAKRAREIANDSEERHEILEDKPVKLAVDEFASGRCELAPKQKSE